MTTAIIFNTVFPYRTPVFDLLGPHYTVIYSSEREPNRDWQVPKLAHNHIFLKPRYLKYGQEAFLHVNFDIFKTLRKLDPDVLILYGFGPTQQLAFLWGWLHKKKIITWFDGWSHTERNRSKRQLAIQRLFIRHSDACIASSQKGKEYFKSMGAKTVFVAPMAVDNERFVPTNKKRPYDLIYISQLNERKCPLFVADLMNELPGKKLLIIGDGPLKDAMLARLEEIKADYHYISFVPWEEIHHYYQMAKICLLPSLQDHWGLVANEALAAGCPVITTREAGCAGELVISGRSGAVVDLMIASIWAAAVRAIGYEWSRFSENALESVAPYTFAAQAGGIRDAVAETAKEIIYRETRKTLEEY